MPASDKRHSAARRGGAGVAHHGEGPDPLRDPGLLTSRAFRREAPGARPAYLYRFFSRPQLVFVVGTTCSVESTRSSNSAVMPPTLKLKL